MASNNEETVKLPVKPLINPLTPDDESAIDSVLQRLPMIEDLIQRAAEVGLEVGPQAERHEMHKVIAQRLKTHFFPKELPAVQE